MRALLFIISILFLGACAHHGGHKHGHRIHKSKCGERCGKKWDKMDLNNDGKVTKDEFIKNKTEWFAEIDKDKDGSVTKEEKMAFMKSKHEKMKAKKDCDSCK